MSRRDGPQPQAGPSSHASTPRGGDRRAQKRRRGPSSSPDRRRQTPDDEEAAPPPTQELDELLISLRTEVVGIRYYQGLSGEAMQVLNASGEQVGHVPRGMAERLAYLMDLRSINVEGVMLGQNLDRLQRYKLPMELRIYARPSLHEVLEKELEWATPEGRGFAYMRMQEVRRAGGGSARGGGDAGAQRIFDGLTKVSKDTAAADSLMAALTAGTDVANLTVHPSPPSIASGDLTTDLLRHQSQALQWMVEHENPTLPKKPSDPPVQFWKRQKAEVRGAQDYWLNVATNTPEAKAPVLGRGGILADTMGLGKTLTILALVLATRRDKVGKDVTGTTLIVCPPSVLSNWEEQIKSHVVDGKLRYYVYHLDKKRIPPKELAKYDVVLTTYQMLRAESIASGGSPAKAKKTEAARRPDPLMVMKWKRVIGDEGHILRNPKTIMHNQFAALQAERRWLCTGTPIINGPSDLGSLLHCVDMCAPLGDPKWFRACILRPLNEGSEKATHLLQAIVAQVLLRRTKDTKDKEDKRILELPEIRHFEAPVTLDPESRAIYDDLYADSVRSFQESLRGDHEPGQILSLLTRMRQVCLSSDLVPRWYLDSRRDAAARRSRDGAEQAQVPQDAVDAKTLVPELREDLIKKLALAVADQEECPVCFDILNDPRITDCGHSFCFACIAEVIRLQTICPMDRHGITLSSLLELPPDETGFEEVSVTPPSRSAKIVELVRLLTDVVEPNDKSLVFSQFTTFLDRIAAVLQEEGIPFCRYDGSMSLRREVIAQFQTPYSKPSSPVVMLISLKSGGVGLNLTAANNVFLCDPWWQSAIEAQAIDRAHRMGQTKAVNVYQLIAEDTVEAKVLEIQKRKDKMVAKAFEKSGTAAIKSEKKRARFEELKRVFGVEE